MATSFNTRPHPRHTHREWSAFVSDPPLYPTHSRRACRPQHCVSCQCGTMPRRLWPDAGNRPFKMRLDRNDGHRVAHASGASLDLCPASESIEIEEYGGLKYWKV